MYEGKTLNHKVIECITTVVENLGTRVWCWIFQGLDGENVFKKRSESTFHLWGSQHWSVEFKQTKHDWKIHQHNVQYDQVSSEEENTHFEVMSGKSPLTKWWFLSVSCTLWIQICITVDQEKSGPGLITMLNACPHTSPTPHCSLPPKSRPLPFASPFVYLLIESAILCSDCIKCDCFICSGSTHRLRPALCLSVHQFTGILWINTSPKQTAQHDLNDFLQQ